jgi:hypothetical protein
MGIWAENLIFYEVTESFFWELKINLVKKQKKQKTLV